MKYKVIYTWYAPLKKYEGTIGELIRIVPSIFSEEQDGILLTMVDGQDVMFSRYELEEADALELND
ncbi:MAG TPA: hypothetical protein PKD55_01460 [Bellilinea sp.]|nr:hypothetical protein [Bellilinea sp.]